MQVIERFRQTPLFSIGISSITLSELEYGVMKSSKQLQNKHALAQFMAPLEILPYENLAAQCYGNLRAHLERKGTPIGALDMLIAAHALSVDCTVITNNVKEFERVPNLRVENWCD